MPKRSESASKPSLSSLNLHLVATGIALLRVFVGLKFLQSAFSKWGWLGTPRLETMLTGWAKNAAWDAYGQFLTQTAIPNAPLFTYLVFFGELGVGLLLVFGFCTRLAALLGVLMNANFLLATWHLGAANQGINQAFIAIQFVLLLIGAGRVYGMDVRLARRRPGWILW